MSGRLVTVILYLDLLITQTVYNPKGPSAGTLRVARGGSWFCAPNYCSAYRPGFRGKSPPVNSFNNVGFRCVRDVRLKVL